MRLIFGSTNTDKLHDELIAGGVPVDAIAVSSIAEGIEETNPFASIVNPVRTTYIDFEDENLEHIIASIAIVHDPTAIESKTELELLKEQVANLQAQLDALQNL